MTIISDAYAHVRASQVCPLCDKDKGEGLMVCWPCFSEHGFRDRLEGEHIQDKIAQREIELRRQA